MGRFCCRKQGPRSPCQPPHIFSVLLQVKIFWDGFCWETRKWWEISLEKVWRHTALTRVRAMSEVLACY